MSARRGEPFRRSESSSRPRRSRSRSRSRSPPRPSSSSSKKASFKIPKKNAGAAVALEDMLPKSFTREENEKKAETSYERKSLLEVAKKPGSSILNYAQDTKERDRQKKLEQMSNDSSAEDKSTHGVWLTQEYKRRRKTVASDDESEPTLDEIVKQERLPKVGDESFKEPITAWVECTADVVPGYNKDFLPEEPLERPPSPVKMNHSITQWLDLLKENKLELPPEEPEDDKDVEIIRQEGVIRRVKKSVMKQVLSQRSTSGGRGGRGGGRTSFGSNGFGRGRDDRGTNSHENPNKVAIGQRDRGGRSIDSSPGHSRLRQLSGASPSPRSEAFRRGSSGERHGVKRGRDESRRPPSPSRRPPSIDGRRPSSGHRSPSLDRRRHYSPGHERKYTPTRRPSSPPSRRLMSPPSSILPRLPPSSSAHYVDREIKREIKREPAESDRYPHERRGEARDDFQRREGRLQSPGRSRDRRERQRSPGRPRDHRSEARDQHQPRHDRREGRCDREEQSPRKYREYQQMKREGEETRSREPVRADSAISSSSSRSSSSNSSRRMSNPMQKAQEGLGRAKRRAPTPERDRRR